MKHEVYITARAETQLKAAANNISVHAPLAAERWYSGFVRAIVQIGSNPQRYAIIPESADFPLELRQLTYGRRRNYRAIFSVRDDQVLVLAIRHAAQQDLSLEDLNE
jgi:plasmid stabilization system protein ParE